MITVGPLGWHFSLQHDTSFKEKSAQYPESESI